MPASSTLRSIHLASRTSSYWKVIVPVIETRRLSEPSAVISAIKSSAMPCVIWYGSGPCVYSPMMVPMIEPTPVRRATVRHRRSRRVRPSRAASSAADTPAIPAPSTQMSAVTMVGEDWAGRRRTRVVIAVGILLT